MKIWDVSNAYNEFVGANVFGYSRIVSSPYNEIIGADEIRHS